MKYSNYIIDRASIYIGIVVENKGEVCSLEDKSNKHYLSSYCAYRPIIFTFDEERQANDLLYNSTNYPVLNYSFEYSYRNPNNKIVVIDTFCLNDLLKYLGYLELLDLNDIIHIQKEIFTYKFLYENSSLFGYERISPDDKTKYDYLSNHLEELTPEQKIKGRKIVKVNSYYYAKTKEGIFSDELFELLCKCANSNISLLLGDGNFKPNKNEGMVRRLRRV